MKFSSNIHILLKSGNGGHGSNHAYLGRQKKMVYDGGDGGDGGDIIVFVDANEISLFNIIKLFGRKLEAENGVNGGNADCHGRKGKDLKFGVPYGTKISKDGLVYKVDMEIILQKGGIGGKGSAKTKTNSSNLGEFVSTIACQASFIPSFDIVVFHPFFDPAVNETFSRKFMQKSIAMQMDEIYPFNIVDTNIYVKKTGCFLPCVNGRNKCIIENNFHVNFENIAEISMLKV